MILQAASTDMRILQGEPLFVLDGRTVSFPDGLKTAEFTHTIHRFPGKFVPQVARELLALAKVEAGAGVIVDPFCGSGTTLVEAATLGLRSLGADFDPLGALISTVKTTPLTMREIGDLEKYWANSIPVNVRNGGRPEISNLNHWFTEPCIAELAYLKARCLQLPDRLRSFSLVVFSSILRRVSNADDQTQKTYVSGTLRKVPPAPRDLFPAFMAKAISGIRSFSESCIIRPVVMQADARLTVGPDSIGGIVTSPPYLDSIDYVYNQMLEYFWLYEELGLQSQADIKSLRSEPIGFRRGPVDQTMVGLSSISRVTAGRLAPLIESIASTSRKEAEHVAGYFKDYAEHLTVCRRAMGNGTRYVLSVGESVVRANRVETPDLLVSLFEDSGFRLVGRCSYQIKRHYMKFPRRANSGTIKLDHILAFEKI
jgi:hypothetical protein